MNLRVNVKFRKGKPIITIIKKRVRRRKRQENNLKGRRKKKVKEYFESDFTY